MSRTQKKAMSLIAFDVIEAITFLEIRDLKKEELELRKLKKTKSFLKEDIALNG